MITGNERNLGLALTHHFPLFIVVIEVYTGSIIEQHPVCCVLFVVKWCKKLLIMTDRHSREETTILDSSHFFKKNSFIITWSLANRDFIKQVFYKTGIL